MNLKNLLDLSSAFKSTERIITEHAPAILTAVGVAGTVSTAVLTGKAAYEARKVVADELFMRNSNRSASEERLDDLDRKEKVTMLWKLYLPAVGVGTLSCAAIIGANHVSAKRLAAAGLAYNLAEKNFGEYKEKAEKHLGLKKTQQVQDEVAADRVKRDLDNSDKIVLVEGSGKVLLHDAYSGRPFTGKVEEINKAVNDINRALLQEDSQTVSDFYDIIGLKHTSISDEMGWNQAEPLRIVWTTVDPGDGMPAAHSFDFESRPILRPWNSASFR